MQAAVLRARLGREGYRFNRNCVVPIGHAVFSLGRCGLTESPQKRAEA